MQPVTKVPRSISHKQYMSLCFNGIHGFPNVIPNEVRKRLPKFSGNHLVSASHHVELFIDLMGDYKISHDDVHMKLFVQTLEGDARDWFSFYQHVLLHPGVSCILPSWSNLEKE